jgi:Tol biopolymer transport system component
MRMQLGANEQKAALERILASNEMSGSPRMAQLLRYLVEETIAGRGTRLKETVIGIDVFARQPSYDPKTDPVVRVEVRRLRSKLLEYYDGSGKTDPVRVELPKGSYQASFSQLAPVAATPARWRPLMGAAILAATGLGIWILTPTQTPVGVPRLITGNQDFSRTPVFSPDGETLIFSRDGSGEWSHIYKQPVGSRVATAITSGEVRDYEPAWSSEGAIAFLREKAGGRYGLMWMGSSGGSARELSEVAVRSSVSFTGDGGAIVAADRDSESSPTRLVKVSVADGKKIAITQPPKDFQGDQQAHVQPGGKWIAFVRAKEASVQDLWRVPVEGNESAARAITKEKRLIAGFDWTADGRQLVVATSRNNEARSLWRVDPERGLQERIAVAGIGAQAPAISRKGERLAFVTRLSDTNLWRAELGPDAKLRPITNSIQPDSGPQISPDGKWVAFRSIRSGFDEVWISSADGSNSRQLTSMNGPTTGSARWSPDGTKVVFDSRPDGNGDIFTVAVSGGAPVQVTREKSNDVLPSWSRDGRFIYFTSDRSGAWEVYKMAATGGVAQQVTHSGGSAGFESMDGKFLYFVKRSGDGGVFRMSLPEGKEERMAALGTNLWGQWALGAKGLYYAVFGAAGERAIRRLDLATGKTRDVVALSRMPVQFDSGMSVAADESWICWSQLDAAGSDIFVIDSFR